MVIGQQLAGGKEEIVPGIVRKLFSIGEVARQLQAERWWLQYQLERGTLPGPAFVVAGRRLFTEEDVRAIEAALKDRPDLRQKARESRGQRPCPTAD
jgi:hypothetical protein